MSPDTETNLALTLATLSWLQENGGDVPPRGKVTAEKLAAFSREIGCPVSATTIRRTEAIALSKLSHALKPQTQIQIQ